MKIHDPVGQKQLFTNEIIFKFRFAPAYVMYIGLEHLHNIPLRSLLSSNSFMSINSVGHRLPSQFFFCLCNLTHGKLEFKTIIKSNEHLSRCHSYVQKSKTISLTCHKQEFIFNLKFFT